MSSVCLVIMLGNENLSHTLLMRITSRYTKNNFCNLIALYNHIEIEAGLEGRSGMYM